MTALLSYALRKGRERLEHGVGIVMSCNPGLSCRHLLSSGFLEQDGSYLLPNIEQTTQGTCDIILGAKEIYILHKL